MSGRKSRAVLVIAGVLLGALAAAVLLTGNLVSERGPVHVPYPAGEVTEVRVLGAVDVYVDGEPKPGASVFGAIALLMLATASFTTMWALRLAGARRRLVRLWLLTAAGLSVAAADELLAIHESVGHNLPFLADLPGVTRPDDLLLALYLPAAAVFGWWFRDVLREHRIALWCFGAGLVCFALSAGSDLVSLRAEEWFELLAGLFIAAGLIALIHHHLREHLRRPVVPPAAAELRVRRVSRPRPRQSVRR